MARVRTVGAVTGVELEEVSIRYGDVVAVDRLTLQVSHGRVLGMLGGNGAGKSSTLRAIGGVIAHATPAEHVDLVASLRGTRGGRAVSDELIERFGLSAERDRPAGTF